MHHKALQQAEREHQEKLKKVGEKFVEIYTWIIENLPNGDNKHRAINQLELTRMEAIKAVTRPQ